MFWDKVSSIYDFFETAYNRKVYTGTGKKVAELIDATDSVLEATLSDLIQAHSQGSRLKVA